MAESCKGKICPKLSAPAKLVKCIEHKCAHYQQILGFNANTGEQLAQWDCAFNWVNLLLIENSQQQRQTGAAVESFRNETVKSSAELAGAIFTLGHATTRAAELAAPRDVNPVLEHRKG